MAWLQMARNFMCAIRYLLPHKCFARFHLLKGTLADNQCNVTNLEYNWHQILFDVIVNFLFVADHELFSL